VQYVLWIGSQTKFLTKLWTFEKSPVCIVTVVKARCATTKLVITFWLKIDPTDKFLNVKNRLILFSSSSSTHRHTSTRSCYNIYSRLWQLSVPTFRIFEDFDWAPVIFTQDVQRKTYWILLWKYFFSKKIKNRSRWLHAELNSKCNHRDRIFENFSRFLKMAGSDWRSGYTY
jgi:hypothetical protein